MFLVVFAKNAEWFKSTTALISAQGYFQSLVTWLAQANFKRADYNSAWKWNAGELIPYFLDFKKSQDFYAYINSTNQFVRKILEGIVKEGFRCSPKLSSPLSKRNKIFLFEFSSFKRPVIDQLKLPNLCVKLNKESFKNYPIIVWCFLHYL